MPAKSAKQFRFMAMIAHNKLGATGGADKPPKSVAQEMVDATPSNLRSQYMKKKKKGY